MRHESNATPTRTWNLDEEIVWFTKEDPWTTRDACEGTQIFGATGAGKTSGSGRTLAHAFLKAGFGGLVLTAKSSETELWIQYAKETGREKSVIVFGPNEKYREYWRLPEGKRPAMNFLEYEARRPGEGAGLTENLVNMFGTVMELGERGQGSARSDEKYWSRAYKQLLRNCLEAMILAGRRLRLPDIYKLIVSMPETRSQALDAQWRQESFCWQMLVEADKRSRDGKLTPMQEADLELTGSYFLNEIASLHEKTRSSIISTFTSMADSMMRGHMRELFSGELNIGPEATHKGAILILDLPVHEYGDVGLIAQVLWKYQWQKATERRRVEGDATRPVFLWADEAQMFVSPYDMLFQTTARSARAATVYLTQNVSNYLATFGGDSRAVTDSLLGNLASKCWHANGDAVTNNHAAETIGMHWVPIAGFSRNTGDVGYTPPLPFQAQQGQGSISGNMQRIYRVDPTDFTQLRTGGEPHGFIVDGILFKNGRTFSNGENHLRVAFRQR